MALSDAEDLRTLQRQLETDPDDSALRLRYLHALARVYGEQALPLLRNRQRWTSAPVELQDAAIGAVSRRLGEHFELQDVEAFSCGGESHRIACFRHRRTGIDFQLLPGGGFRMGTADVEEEVAFCERFDVLWDPEMCEDESPARWIEMAPFLIARAPLNRSQWRALNAERGGAREAALPQPASWLEARRWLERAGDGLRLPQEREWEYACRAGTLSRFFWGNDFDPTYCWYEENSATGPHAAEEHARRGNAFGLVDTLGNLGEWCSDWDGSGRVFRVYRGGNWQESPPYCRAAYRESAVPGDDVGGLVGLRAACSIP